MKFKLGLSLIVLALLVSAGFAQTDLQIKKKISRKMPNVPMAGMTPAMEKQLKEANNTTSTVYLKGSNTRTDMIMKMPSKIGTMESHTFSTVVQCAQQRTITFNTKDKKYYQYQYGGTGGQSSAGAASAKSGGSVTVTGNVTDTGERAKVFGYDARRLKQTYTFMPGANACLKDSMQIDIDGWYADLPEFSCPMKISAPDNAEGNCIDKYDYQIKGAVTGVALKEVKKISMDGQVMTITEEEATEVTKTTLADSFFAPPVGYVAGNTLINTPVNPAKTAATTPPATTSSSSDSLSLPSAGVEPTTVGEKKAGTIRIGVVIPKVTTPESKNNPDAGSDIALATRNYFVELLKAENVEAIALESDLVDEAKNRNCDYIFYANVTQKRGGGMFKSMILQGAIMAGGMMVPGVGGMIASTVASQVMGQTMGKAAKPKDEFSLEYKIVGLDKTVLSQATTKKKTEKEGEDVLTPQIKEASTKVLGEIAKKGNK